MTHKYTPNSEFIRQRKAEKPKSRNGWRVVWTIIRYAILTQAVLAVLFMSAVGIDFISRMVGFTPIFAAIGLGLIIGIIAALLGETE